MIECFSLETELVNSVSLENVESRHDIAEDTLTEIRFRFAEFLRSHGVPMPSDAHLPIGDGDLSSEICGELLFGWARLANDPGAAIARWTINGAPANVAVMMPELKGIMPEVDDDLATMDPSESVTDFDNFTNHGQLEDDQEAMTTIQSYIDKGYLKSFESLQACTEFLGTLPALSKLACLSKDRFDATSRTRITKRRVILDSKESNVKSASSRQFRAVLPGVIDAVGDAMALLDDIDDDDIGVEHLVLDASDAFWDLILHPEERRYYCGRVGDKYLVYLRTAQGSRGAPFS